MATQYNDFGAFVEAQVIGSRTEAPVIGAFNGSGFSWVESITAGITKTTDLIQKGLSPGGPFGPPYPYPPVGDPGLLDPDGIPQMWGMQSYLITWATNDSFYLANYGPMPAPSGIIASCSRYEGTITSQDVNGGLATCANIYFDLGESIYSLTTHTQTVNVNTSTEAQTTDHWIFTNNGDATISASCVTVVISTDNRFYRGYINECWALYGSLIPLDLMTSSSAWTKIDSSTWDVGTIVTCSAYAEQVGFQESIQYDAIFAGWAYAIRARQWGLLESTNTNLVWPGVWTPQTYVPQADHEVLTTVYIEPNGSLTQYIAVLLNP